ncbi:MAG TPA: hypothetical protein VGQ83_35755 [Polyangia bacterium]|jgi:hypothetical protein
MRFDAALLGVKRHLIPLPGLLWRRAVARTARGVRRRLGFMTREHHAVRDFVVSELPRAGRPLDLARIAAATGLTKARAGAIVGELERKLTFLYRDAAGAVEWAYPVTVAATPHALAFSTGERLNGA